MRRSRTSLALHAAHSQTTGDSAMMHTSRTIMLAGALLTLGGCANPMKSWEHPDGAADAEKRLHIRQCDKQAAAGATPDLAGAMRAHAEFDLCMMKKGYVKVD